MVFTTDNALFAIGFERVTAQNPPHFPAPKLALPYLHVDRAARKPQRR